MLVATKDPASSPHRRVPRLRRFSHKRATCGRGIIAAFPSVVRVKTPQNPTTVPEGSDKSFGESPRPRSNPVMMSESINPGGELSARTPRASTPDHSNSKISTPVREVDHHHGLLEAWLVQEGESGRQRVEESQGRELLP
jgi:hypothetical protein